tara:strand:- start:451 stop:666 length:216 start_codon:yes stop_codon:yes gene_type:complete
MWVNIKGIMYNLEHYRKIYIKNIDKDWDQFPHHIVMVPTAGDLVVIKYNNIDERNDVYEDIMNCLIPEEQL